MTSTEANPPPNQDNHKTITDKNNIKLIYALKNGLIEEKNKNKQFIIENENLQKEIEELKKLNTELNSKNEKLDEENQKIKEENVTKQELINKLKEELQKHLNKSTKKLSNFFSSLLESDSPQNIDLEEKDKNNLKIESLEQENFKLNKDLAEMKTKLDFTNNKLNESINDYNILKENSKKNIEEIEIKYKKQIDEIISEKNNNEKNLKQKLEESDKKLVEYLNTLREKEIIIKSIESIKGDRDKDIITMKEKVRIAEETLNNNNEQMKIIQNKNKLMSDEIIQNQKDKENEDLMQERNRVHYLFKESKGNKINICFKTPLGKEMFVVPENITVKNLLLGFLKEFELDQNELGKQYNFLYNAMKMNVLDESNIIEYGLKNGCSIIFVDTKNIMGG